jgi:hypothetical protein
MKFDVRIWDVIRGLIKENFSFGNIKDLIGVSGLPIHELSHLQQRNSSIGSTKSQLMDGIDKIYSETQQEQKQTFLLNLLEEILNRNSDLHDEIDSSLRNIGWQLQGNIPLPLELSITIDLKELPMTFQENITKALKRYRDGDFPGCITTICGLVDNLTENIFKLYSIGDHASCKYHERVGKSIKAFETEYKNQFKGIIQEKELNHLWNNHSKSISQAGYVLGSFRRHFSDVHGEKETNLKFVQISIDCAIYIIRNLLNIYKER